jgi:hypothetical protein
VHQDLSVVRRSNRELDSVRCLIHTSLVENHPIVVLVSEFFLFVAKTDAVIIEDRVLRNKTTKIISGAGRGVGIYHVFLKV